jgi:hypothetical protein
MKRITGLLCSCAIVWGCGGLAAINSNPEHAIDTVSLALMLDETIRTPSLKNSEIGVLTFVDLNNLDQADPLGRYLQEKMLFHLFDLGYRVVEMRLGKEFRYAGPNGEILLTRLKTELRNASHRELKSILVGTYIRGGNRIYVSCRLVELETEQVRASGEIFIREGNYLHHLLAGFPEVDKKLSPPPPETKIKDDIFERFPPPAKSDKK